jgi:hypothetical protein
MSTTTIMVAIGVSLLLVVVVAGILAAVERLAVRRALGVPVSGRLELHFRKAVHAFEHTQM